MGHYERVVDHRKAPNGNGFQYQLKFVDSDALEWLAASRIKKDAPQLVAAFEQAQETSNDEGGQSVAAALVDELNEQRGYVEEQGLAIADLRRQLQQQKQQLELQRSHAAGKGADGLSPSPGASPEYSPQQSPASTSRFAKREPRSQDLKEYDGAAGTKLDEWLEELGLAVDLYELNSHESIRFGTSRLRGAALQWWRAMGKADQATIATIDLLATALRLRFQPITSAHVAREKLLSLSQGSRHVNEYIAEFQRWHAQLPTMSMEDAVFQFERGLRTDIAEKLKIQGVTKLSDATALAARVGALSGSSSSGAARTGRLNQMDEGNEVNQAAEQRLDRMELALNALAQRSGYNENSGLGAKTQAKRGYGKQRGQQQQQNRPPTSLPQGMQIPGVPEDVLAQRWAAKSCLRCGEDGHRSMACPNNISSSRSSN